MTDLELVVLTNLSSILVFYSFMKCVLKRKAEKPYHYILIAVLYVLNVLAVSYLDQLVKAVVILVLFIGFTMLIFKVSFKKSLLANLIYTAITFSLQTVALLVMMRVTGKEWRQISNNESFIGDLICELLMFLIVMVLNTVFKKGVLTNLDIKGWITFALYPLFTIVAVLVLVFSVDKETVDNDVYISLVILATGMFILSVLIFALIDNVVRRENDIHEKEIMLGQTEHLNQMYRSLSDEREKQKARSHDYMNHLNVMLMLAREGKVDEQIHYIEEQLGKEIQSVDIIDTGNTLINAVLNIKYLEAKEKGIIIPFIADNLKDIKISDSDLVTIITNILDNAIEAVQKCDEKRIVFKIIKDSDTLIIDSTNTYKGHLPAGGDFGTTKSDKKNHGFGLANIKNTVEANNGNCFIDTEGGIFHISITLPLA
ncbi:MAG: GHKL domain-containing protein [Clostridiales bacterium]|nr:GHKL domain-containing protein [Clostridiales bacterium]